MFVLFHLFGSLKNIVPSHVERALCIYNYIQEAFVSSWPQICDAQEQDRRFHSQSFSCWLKAWAFHSVNQIQLSEIWYFLQNKMSSTSFLNALMPASWMSALWSWDPMHSQQADGKRKRRIVESLAALSYTHVVLTTAWTRMPAIANLLAANEECRANVSDLKYTYIYSASPQYLKMWHVLLWGMTVFPGVKSMENSIPPPPFASWKIYILHREGESHEHPSAWLTQENADLRIVCFLQHLFESQVGIYIYMKNRYFWSSRKTDASKPHNTAGSHSSSPARDPLRDGWLKPH